MVAKLYMKLQLFDSNQENLELMPKTFSQRFDSTLKFRQGVKLGEELNVMMRALEDDSVATDMSISMQQDLNMTGAGYKLADLRNEKP